MKAPFSQGGGRDLKRAIRWCLCACASLFMTVVCAWPLTTPAQAAMTGTMSVGSRGSYVAELESRLGFLGYYHGPIDGDYSWGLYWAVRDFQYAFGMRIDGVAGPKTLAMLRKATVHWPGMEGAQSPKAVSAKKGGSNPVSTTGTKASAPAQSSTASIPAGGVSGISQNDLNLMAHVVYGEARNQPFIGQVAVAAVILNRYHSSKFPHSIPGIIYQPGGFDSVSNGQAWLGLHKQNLQAAVDAVHGWDPTHGALYYWNPATATSSWIWSQPIMLTIGNHVFAK